MDIIKEFDIENQRSINKIEKIEILPMVEFFYSDFEYNQLEKIVSEKIQQSSFSKETLSILHKDLENLKNHNELDRLIRYLPFLTEKHYTLSDFSENKTIFFIDYHRIIEQNKILIEEIKDWYLSSSDYPKMGFSVLYDFNELLVKKSVMVDYLEYQYNNSNNITFSVFGKEILVYSQNLDMLYKDLSNNIGKKTQLITFKNDDSKEKFVDVLKSKEIDYTILTKKSSMSKNIINILIFNTSTNFSFEASFLNVIN